MQKFKPINNDQLYLLPPNVEDFIPENHLAKQIASLPVHSWQKK